MRFIIYCFINKILRFQTLIGAIAVIVILIYSSHLDIISESFDSFLFIIPIVIVVLKLFFPIYKNRLLDLSHYTFLKKSHKITKELIFYLISPLYVILFLTAFVFLYKGFSNIGLYFLSILTGYSIDISFRYFFEKKGALHSIPLILLNVYLLTATFSNSKIFFLISLLNLTTFILVYDYKEKSKPNLFTTSYKTLIVSNIKVFLDNKKLNLRLLLGFATIKIGLYLFIRKHPDDFFVPSMSGYMNFIATSTIIYFTYIFNNYWGFQYKKLYYFINLPNRDKKLFTFYLSHFIFITVLDFFYTLIFFFSIHEDILKLTITYFTSASIFLPLGLLASTYYPVNIKNINPFREFNIKQNVIVSTCFLLISYCYHKITIYDDTYFISILIFIIGIICNYLIWKKSVLQPNKIIERLSF